MRRIRQVVLALVLCAGMIVVPASARADPPPIQATVHIGKMGTVDAIGTALIPITVSCNITADFSEWFMELGQKIRRQIHVASEDGDVPGCGPTPVTFEADISGDGFDFVIKPGRATITLEIQVCNGDISCDVKDVSRVVTLRKLPRSTF